MPFLQADRHVLNTIDLLHSHAHGVGTGLSIHPERFDLHMAQLCACGRCGQQTGDNSRDHFTHDYHLT